MSNPPLPPNDSSGLPPDIEPKGLRVTDTDLRMHESQTARTITITLLVMLGVTFVLNIITLIVLTRRNRLDAAPMFERMFAIWMPLLSGLVGSAVTFYLTKEKK